jgi:heat shock protein HslJ/uncharacterized lipoprotein YbaY
MGDYERLARGAAAALVALAMTGAAMAQDGFRMIDGRLTYRERAALPPDALAVVEARDARGRLLGEATLRTRGAQVPIGFQIAVPAGRDAELRAALVVDGKPAWYATDVAISAGTDPVQLGDIVLSRFIPMGFASTFRCGDREVSIGFFEANAVIEVAGVRTVLEPAAAGAGTRFEAAGDPGTWVLNRGDAVTVSLGGEALPECSVVPPATPRPYRAQGNEPRWTLSIANGRLTLTADDAARTVEAALPEAAFEDGAFVYRIAAAALELRMAHGLCRNDPTGMPYPETVAVMLDGQKLTGCGGDPMELLDGATWTVEGIAGQATAADAPVTLAFAEDGAVTGQAPCNRYATSVAIGGEGMSLGQIAATRKSCTVPQMDQERAFFAALASATRFDIGPDGALLLYGPASPEPVITARR